MNRQDAHSKPARHITLRTLLATAAALALAPAAAQAATVGATIGPDPLEDRVFSITATGDDPSRKVYARFRAAPGPPCGASYRGDTGADVFFADPLGKTTGWIVDQPGAYKICLFLQGSSSDERAAAVSEVSLSVRANVATATVQAPPTALEGSLVTFAVAGTTEVPREVYVKSKPAGSGPCAPSYGSDRASAYVATRLPANGAFAIPVTTDAYDLPGTGPFIICAWVQESSSDEIAEAVGSTLITMGPPLPVISDLDVSPPAFSRRGPLVRFRLNTPATVRFTVWAKRGGRYVPLPGSFHRRGKAGANTFRYSGRAGSGGRRLRPGRYRMVATARNSSGAGASVEDGFRIRRR